MCPDLLLMMKEDISWQMSKHSNSSPHKTQVQPETFKANDSCAHQIRDLNVHSENPQKTVLRASTSIYTVSFSNRHIRNEIEQKKSKWNLIKSLFLHFDRIFILSQITWRLNIECWRDINHDGWGIWRRRMLCALKLERRLHERERWAQPQLHTRNRTF